MNARLIGFQSPLIRPKCRNALDLGVEDLGGDAVAVHRRESRVRVPVAGILRGFEVPLRQVELAAALVRPVLGRGFGDGVVERVAQPAGTRSRTTVTGICTWESAEINLPTGWGDVGRSSLMIPTV